MSEPDPSDAPNKAHALDGGIPSQFSAGRIRAAVCHSPGPSPHLMGRGGNILG